MQETKEYNNGSTLALTAASTHIMLKIDPKLQCDEKSGLLSCKGEQTQKRIVNHSDRRYIKLIA